MKQPITALTATFEAFIAMNTLPERTLHCPKTKKRA